MRQDGVVNHNLRSVNNSIIDAESVRSFRSSISVSKADSDAQRSYLRET